MIAHKILTKKGLEDMARRAITQFCSKRDYPIPRFRISNVPHGGGAIGGFSRDSITIYISPKIFDRFSTQSPESTVHDLFRLLYHAIGNVFEVIGIFSVSVFIGAIWWLDKKYEKEEI